MQLVTLSELSSYPGPYPGMKHHVVANRENGYQNFEIIYSKLPRGAESGMHNHPHSEKLQLVLTGELEIWNEDRSVVYKVPAGSGVLFPPAEYHQCRNTYDGETTYLVVYSPGR